ncbi:MAG TPA: citrate transporter [Burkholderiaceae bacterium]|nr:citrate transporter [Burkholderiaceae bacterium]
MHATPIGAPLEFIIFGMTLGGVTLLHRHALHVAATGLVALLACKLAMGGFASGPGLPGLARHLGGEWVGLANLLGLLLGFAQLARHVERSGLPVRIASVLPTNWAGAFGLLATVFVLSAFLDNIAAALIGGAIAHAVFRERVCVAYVAALVAAANAGGAGSVLGDTTTTMLWLGGVDPLSVAPAFVASAAAFACCGIPASILQQRYAPLVAQDAVRTRVDRVLLGIVGTALAATLAANLVVHAWLPRWSGRLPWAAIALWGVLAASAPRRPLDRQAFRDAIGGTVFLLCLVLAASLLPVDRLPPPSHASIFGLGILSAVFDNIPLTALALQQGGYEWALLAYAIGFGGSMLWFGSSAGVALSAMFPDSRSTVRWAREAWPVAIAYAVGFGAFLALFR